MPLPDERPRQSVANLIGRFEQTKRPSTSGTGSRSSSVVSHTTGDSAKEEAKEKREWPPKSSTASERPPIIIPSSSWTRRNAEAQSSSPPNPEPPATQAGPIEDSAILTPRPSSANSITDDTKAVSSPVRPENTGVSSETTPNISKTPIVITPKPLTKAPASKTATTTTPKTPLKAPAKPQAKPVPAAQPLRPQHTGPASITAAARKSVAKPTPSTPSRAKTPSRSPAAPAARPKTPSSTRPKTPSGLFAPTAASLARARSNQPPPPTPTKKVTLSSSSADRLSKPTAASLSRARTPTSTTSSPARGAVKPPIRGGATRGTFKPRVSTTTIRANKDGIPPIPKTGSVPAAVLSTALGVADAVPAVVDVEHNSYEGDRVHDDQTHHSDLLGPNAGPVADEVHDEQNVVGPSREPRGGLEEADEPTEEGGISIDVVDTFTTELQEPDEPVEVAPLVHDLAQEPDAETHDPDVDASATSESETMSVSEDRMDEVKLREHASNDIEDMVNLLETVKVRPASIASIPDEVHEIPDEE